MGADVNRKSGDDELSTALHAAVGHGHLGCVEALLEQPEIEVDSMSPNGFTALHVCVSTLYPDDGRTAEEIVPAMATALITKGADIHKEARPRTPESYSSPFVMAICSDHVAVVKLMLKMGNRPPAIIMETLMEELRDDESLEDMFELLTEAGWGPPRAPEDDARATAADSLADINEIRRAPSRQRPPENAPPRESYLLQSVARRGEVRLVKELLASGVDPNSVDAAGSTALHAAANAGHDDVVKALLGVEGIAVDKHDGGKVTALYRAAVADRGGAVKALLKAGASVAKAKSPKGQSVLHKVATRPAGAVLEALLKAGALPPSTGQKGLTPLHVACEHVNARGTVEALLRAGALPGHCWNDTLQSPLLVACRRGNLEAVRHLLPRLSLRQINMSCCARAGGETPLVAAIRSRDQEREIVEIVEAV
ncbi:unnamed protein product, partial [Hapterophycus canaliculatus]